MSKRKRKKKQKKQVINNLVAKVAHMFNRCATFQDKTKYQRKSKHKGKDFE